MHLEPAKPVVITPARYVLLPVATLMTGYTVKAIQCKIARGDWQEGDEVMMRGTGRRDAVSIFARYQVVPALFSLDSRGERDRSATAVV
jgi:hypothetical protein